MNTELTRLQKRQKWLELIGMPSYNDFKHELKLIKVYDEPQYDCELYLQANGPHTYQRVMMVFPKNLTAPAPAAAVPFYYPEAMLGYDPETGVKLPKFEGIEMLLHLVGRGYAAATADSYHLTYISEESGIDEFSRWKRASAALMHDNPDWSGIGKLAADTSLLIDALASDRRVDSERIGIAGHSLGGKMAFYTGCLDDRVKAILASDFGIGWEQTNWNDPWYWGDKANMLKSMQLDHTSLLDSAAPKPFCLLAGQYDNEYSRQMMNNASGYADCPSNLLCINHASGHRPPMQVLEAGYEFLDRRLKY